MQTVLVSGALANKHLNGGEAWVRLHWILGLQRLGFSVQFVEHIEPRHCVDDGGTVVSFESSENRRYFKQIIDAFGLTECASLICGDGVRVDGVPYRELLDIAESSSLLVNISGHLTIEEILRRVRRKAYIDLDPGFTQFWHAEKNPGAHLDNHDFYFTVGENIGRPDCPIPTGGIRWLSKPRFVVLDQWPVSPGGDRHRFTTIASWRGSFGPVQHGGLTFGLKVHEFRKFMKMPQQAPQAFEIALNIHPADRSDLIALQRHGWHIVNPKDVVPDPAAFRRYVQMSGGEFSAAQGIYVDTQCGWVSDRTVRYLASGKPALVQDTGLSRNYPVGEGLVTFRTLDEAVEGAERISRDYDAHARAARALAEEYFDSDKVLTDMLDRMGVAP